MSVGVTSLILALGLGAWVYNYMARRTGEGNARSALIVAAQSAVFIFVFAWSILSLFL